MVYVFLTHWLLRSLVVIYFVIHCPCIFFHLPISGGYFICDMWYLFTRPKGFCKICTFPSNSILIYLFSSFYFAKSCGRQVLSYVCKWVWLYSSIFLPLLFVIFPSILRVMAFPWRKMLLVNLPLLFTESTMSCNLYASPSVGQNLCAGLWKTRRLCLQAGVFLTDFTMFSIRIMSL